jgi:hypothetical protein
MRTNFIRQKEKLHYNYLKNNVLLSLYHLQDVFFKIIVYIYSCIFRT